MSTAVEHSSPRRRIFYKEGIMILTGIIGFTLLITLLEVLLPIAKAQSSDSSVGANVTSPGVYPARILNPVF